MGKSKFIYVKHARIQQEALDRRKHQQIKLKPWSLGQADVLVYYDKVNPDEEITNLF